MVSSLGSFFIIFAIICSITFIFVSITANSNKKIYWVCAVSGPLFIISAYIILLYLLISRDFSVIAVLMNVSSLMELKYRIAASWSSHETSLLFWSFIQAVISLIFFFKTEFLKKYTNAIMTFLSGLFLLYTYFTSNPFQSIPNHATEGLGMNPSLQDVGIMVHPPFLYLSYSIYQLIFCASLANAEFNEEFETDKNVSRWALAILLLAITLGGWWAYRELGWGGYWFFDPVENISLIILLFGIAYHHSLLQKGFLVSKVIFGILPFICIITGTFLVRSGLLVSVHSFASSSHINYLLAFCGLIVVLSIFVVTRYVNKLSIAPKINATNIISHADESLKGNNRLLMMPLSLKHYIIHAGNILWITGALIISASILFPIMVDLVYGEKIEIKQNFFIYNFLPIVLMASALAGIVYFTRNIKQIWVVIFISIPAFIIPILHEAGIMYSLAYYVAALITFGTALRAKEKIDSASLNISSISMLVGHLACGLLIASIAYNNQFKFARTITLSKHETKTMYENFTAELINITYGNGKNYILQKAFIRIYEGSKEVCLLAPELRFYPIEKTISSEVSIFSKLSLDWYGVLSNVENDKATLEIFYHPGIMLIWFSCGLCVFAIILREVPLRGRKRSD